MVTMVTQSVVATKEVERLETNLQYDTNKNILYKKLRQVKRATTAVVLTTSATSSSVKLQENNEAILQKVPQDKFDDVLNEQMEQSNRIVSMQSKSVQQPTTHRQLFISDMPIVVKDSLSWKKAGKTNNFEEEQESKDGFARHAFNQYASDRLGYFREIPDTRHTL